MDVETLSREFHERGWARLPRDAGTAAWAAAAAGPAMALTRKTDAAYRCGGTWFPGVNILPNEPDGGSAALGLPPLSGAPIRFLRAALGFDGIAFDRAQVSVCFPGYPRQGEEESEAAFRYRLNRDAAHVDGLRREMPGRRRRLEEAHGFILGLPLTETEATASPFVIWEGSHEIMRAAFRAALADAPPERWREIDITEPYQEARRRVFDSCRRVALPAQPGEAYVAHRLSLHGVAAWRAAADAPPRAIAYFRPDPFPAASPEWWLERP